MSALDAGVRVTSELVREIISTELTDSQINAFANTAHLVVQENLASKGLSEARLKQIELYLAAHFLSMRDQRKKQVKAGDVAITYQGETSTGLQATLYGQQAMMLDPSGTLASLSQRKATLSTFGGG
jgi:hypothetical protein